PKERRPWHQGDPDVGAARPRASWREPARTPRTWGILIVRAGETVDPCEVVARGVPRGERTMSARGRLSPLDGSFLRLESAAAHMHVGWSAVFDVPGERDRPTLPALRDRVAGRLDQVPWCRWRLQNAPLGLSEPRWVEDSEFDQRAHVVALSEPDEPVSRDAFAAMRDVLLSQPLDRSGALW